MKILKQMNKKLLIISPVFPPYHGGIGYVAKQHADGMRALGYDVEVKHLGNGSPKFKLGNAGRLNIERDVAAADIVHMHYPFFGTAELLPGWKAKWPEKQFFVTYHMDPELPGWKGVVARWYAKHSAPRVFDAADKVFVTTAEYAEAWSNRVWFTQNTAKVVEAPLGVNVERFAQAEASAEWKKEKGINPEIPIVLFVGGMDEPHAFKGVPVLLDAFAQVREEAQLVLVGEGSLRKGFEEQAAGIKKPIHFVGSSSFDELPQWYAAADVFVLPSTTRGEAFGLVLLEAMAAKTACIASELPGVGVVLDHGRAGALVPPNNSDALARQIQKVLRDTDAREEYAERGAEHVSKFTWQNMVDTYHLWYTSTT